MLSPLPRLFARVLPLALACLGARDAALYGAANELVLGVLPFADEREYLTASWEGDARLALLAQRAAAAAAEPPPPRARRGRPRAGAD